MTFELYKKKATSTSGSLFLSHDDENLVCTKFIKIKKEKISRPVCGALWMIER